MATRPSTERVTPRTELRVPVLLSDGWRGELLDASATGLRVRSLLVLRVGDPIEVTLLVGADGRIHLRGRVAWVKPADFGAGAGARGRGGGGDFGIALDESPPTYLALVSERFADM